MTADLYEKNNRYHVMLSWYEDKKRKQKSVATGIQVKGNNKRKAKTRKDEILKEWEKTISEKSLSNFKDMLFSDYLKRWVEESKDRVQPTTYDIYEHMLNKHLYPYFNTLCVKLISVTPEIISEYYDIKEEEGLSPNTVIKHHGVLRAAMQQALKDKLVKENPCVLAEKPIRKKYRGEYYTADELNVLLEFAKGSPIETPVYLAAYFGMRRSEIIGLRWGAIDFTKKTISVEHKVVRKKENGKMTVYATPDLKTESSYRDLQLDETLIEYLRNLKQRQDANRAINGNCHNHNYDDYLCVNDLGNLIQPDYVTAYFGKIIKRNKLKHIRFHDLRHSCGSLLLDLGYSIKDIQGWLGHSNYQTTANIYVHSDPKNRKNMIDSISNALTI